MAVHFGDATWSLPPSAKSAVEKTDPSHAPDSENLEDEVAEALVPLDPG